MYCVGNTLDDDRDVYGREDLLEALYSGRDRQVLLVGMRRTGKSATLLALERRALREERFVPIRIAPEGTTTLEQVRDDFANAISRRRKLLPGLPGGFLKLRKLELDTLLRIAEEAAEDAGKALMVLVDEADVLARIAEDEPELATRLRAGLPAGEHTRFIITGSRRCLRLKRQSIGGGEPVFADFAQRSLLPVLEPIAARALIHLAKRSGDGAVSFSPLQIDWLLRRVGGHPYLLQAVCGYARQFSTGPEQALDVVLSSHEARDAFLQDLERTSPSERLVLQSIMGNLTVDGGLAPFARTLVDIGLLDDNYLISVPVLEDFIERVGWQDCPSRLTDAEAAPSAAQRPQQEALNRASTSDLDNPSPTPSPLGMSNPSLGLEHRPIEVLGSGRFGEVWLVETTSRDRLKRQVAIKFLHRAHADDHGIAARLRDEARVLARIQHRSIVRAEALVELGGRLGVVMEYVPGIDLRDLVEHRDVSEALSPQALAEIVAEVGDALDVAYNRIPGGESKPFHVLHRDIKPHNIRVSDDGDVKVLDFGVASATFAEREANDRFAAGTPAYMAPERHNNDHNQAASDVFSLGAVVLELAVGENGGPWIPGHTTHENYLQHLLGRMRARMGPELGELTGKMMDWSHAGRPSAADVSQRARELARTLPGPDLRTWARANVPQLKALRTPVAARDVTLQWASDSQPDPDITLMDLGLED